MKLSDMLFDAKKDYNVNNVELNLKKNLKNCMNFEIAKILNSIVLSAIRYLACMMLMKIDRDKFCIIIARLIIKIWIWLEMRLLTLSNLKSNRVKWNNWNRINKYLA